MRSVYSVRPHHGYEKQIPFALKSFRLVQTARSSTTLAMKFGVTIVGSIEGNSARYVCSRWIVGKHCCNYHSPETDFSVCLGPVFIVCNRENNPPIGRLNVLFAFVMNFRTARAARAAFGAQGERETESSGARWKDVGQKCKKSGLMGKKAGKLQQQQLHYYQRQLHGEATCTPPNSNKCTTFSMHRGCERAAARTDTATATRALTHEPPVPNGAKVYSNRKRKWYGTPSVQSRK